MTNREERMLTPADIDGYPDGHDEIWLDINVKPEERGRRLIEDGISEYVRLDADIDEWTLLRVKEEWPWWEIETICESKEELRIRLASLGKTLGVKLSEKKSFGSLFVYYAVKETK